MTMNKLPEKLIDFHVHLFPDKLFDAIWSHFKKIYKWNILYKFYYKECIDFLRERGVEKIVYSNYAHKAGIAEYLNRWNVEVVDKHEECYCFAAFHPADNNAVKMAEEVLQHPKIFGFKLHFLVQELYPDDERIFPLYEMVIEKKKKILMHVGTGPISNKYVGYKYFEKVMKRYPEMQIIVPHLGAFEYEKFFKIFAQHESICMDTSFNFFPDEEYGWSLDSCNLENNKDRLLYGSDFPNLIYPYETEIETMQKLNLSDEFYKKIFYENGKNIINNLTGYKNME